MEKHPPPHFSPFKEILLLKGWFEICPWVELWSNFIPLLAPGLVHSGIQNLSPPHFNPTEIHLKFLDPEITTGNVKFILVFLSRDGLRAWEAITITKCDKSMSSIHCYKSGQKCDFNNKAALCCPLYTYRYNLVGLTPLNRRILWKLWALHCTEILDHSLSLPQFTLCKLQTFNCNVLIVSGNSITLGRFSNPLWARFFFCLLVFN